MKTGKNIFALVLIGAGIYAGAKRVQSAASSMERQGMTIGSALLLLSGIGLLLTNLEAAPAAVNRARRDFGL